jgi:hypothetical protein
MSSSGGVVSHNIRWQESVPAGVDLTLRSGVEVFVDLLQQRVDMVAGPELKPKKKEWCLQIASYIARQALLEIQEKEGKKRGDGRKGIEFEPRPDPNEIWWG